MYNIPSNFDAYGGKPGSHYNPYSTQLELSKDTYVKNEEFYYEDGLPGNYFNTRTTFIVAIDCLLFSLCAISFAEFAQIHSAWYAAAITFTIGAIWSLYNICSICSGQVSNKKRIAMLNLYSYWRSLACIIVCSSCLVFSWYVYEIHHNNKHDKETRHLKFMKNMSTFYFVVGGSFIGVAIYLRSSQKAYSHALGRWTTFNKYQNLKS